MSTKILLYDDNTLSPPSDTLLRAMRRRPHVKEVLAKRIKESGLSVPDICRRAETKGYPVSVSAIKFILNGATKNPSIFTLEAIAIGMDIPPLSFIAEVLGIRGDDPNLLAGKFAVLLDVYKEIPASQRSKADAFIDGLMLQLKHIKAQSK